MIQQFSSDQIAKLRNDYNTASVAMIGDVDVFHRLFANCANAALDQLSVAGIRFISALARNERKRRGYGGKE